MSNIGIISALASEAKCFSGRSLPPLETAYITDKISIIISGIGAERAADAAERLLKKNVSALISWGTATGLVNELQSGNLIIPEIVISATGQNYMTDAAWNQTLCDCLTNTSIIVHKKSLFSSNKILNTPQEKNNYYEATGAVAADMESAAIASIAAENGLPFIAIRSVADEADNAIPRCIENNINAYGQANISRLLLELLRAPGQIVSLYHLYTAMNRACYTLKIVANKIQASMDM